MDNRVLLCDNWEFSKNPLGTAYDDTTGWQQVDLPHDWLIYDAKNLYADSTGWYRRTLTVPEDGLRTALRFDGVYMDSRVYVNGQLAGEWKYGYTTFELDITDLLHPGDNLIAVRVDHHAPNSRWYSGAGIYRKVWLRRYAQSHILSDGVYISATPDGTVTVTTETARPAGEEVCGYSLRTTIFDGTTALTQLDSACPAADDSVIYETLRREGFRYAVTTQILHLAEPRLWDMEDPHRYTCVTELLKNGHVVDSYRCAFGIRTAEFTCDRGFFLNGRHVKLHGCCEHHDLGALGAAFSTAAMRRKLELLRGMGINAIRTSHNPPAPELMDLADEMGFLVMDEAFDMWEMRKTDYDYARFFRQWVRRDVASWVRRDRNHPCLIGWSIGNEIYDTHASERGQEIASLLHHLVLTHDPRHNACITIGSNFMASENAQKCTDILKVAGYNYAERLYEDHHKAHPDWMIYGSETSSIVQSRGIYHFPLEQSIVCEDDEQCSALGNSSPAWAAKSHAECILPDRDAEYCAGQFIWTGFDYIGEPTPYSTKNSYFGQLDTAGFYKDSAYMFRSAWTDHKDDPFVHIFPHWDFTEGEIIDVRVASNAPHVALYFNGLLIKEQRFDRLHGRELTLDVKLPYQPGELLAIAWDEDGNEIARDLQRSFGNAAQLRLTPDKSSPKADGQDMIFVDISAYDENGTFVANANNRCFVSVTGAGRLVGLDNGDSTDYEQYKGTSRRLFSGKLLAIIAARDCPGEITVRVSSPSLPDSVLRLEAQEAPACGVSCLAENMPCPADCPNEEQDIPIRKIELLSSGKHFTPDCQEIRFTARSLPENNVYSGEIEYRITTVNGIASNLAVLKDADGTGVTVRCLGDGEFYLRALCKNGTDKYHILSTVKLTGEDLGSPTISPYKFVMGGLYSVSGGNVSNGIQHGAGIGVGGGWFGFENVDFGCVGSDTITLPLFANYSTPVRIRVYDGIPGQGGELLGDFEYSLPSIWLTYQSQTYQLSKVLRGVHTLVIQSDIAYDVQGFVFEEHPKETSELYAVHAERIYGDKFTVEEDAVTGIGNNVTIHFGEFDFTAAPPSRLVITGRTPLDVNSIHVIFTDLQEKRMIAEFTHSEDYKTMSFPVEGIGGKQNVSFVFLPGCNFDFRSFHFE